MSSYSIRNANDLIKGCPSIIEFVSKRPYYYQEYKVVGNAVGASINHMLYRLAHYNGNDTDVFVELLKENKDLFKWLRNSSKIKYRVERLLFKLNFSIAFNLLQVLQLHK